MSWQWCAVVLGIALLCAEVGLVMLGAEMARDVMRHRYLATGFALVGIGAAAWVSIVCNI